jgi:hypothetical protein
MRTLAIAALAASRAVTAVFPQRLVALEDGAVGECDPLGLAIVLAIDESIDASDRAIGLASLAPFDLDGSALKSWQRS